MNKYATDIVESAELTWDNDFNMFEHQEFIVDVCEQAIGNSFLTRNGEVKCFMRDFKEWLLSNRSAFIRWYADPSADTADRPVAFPIATESDFLFFLSHWSTPCSKAFAVHSERLVVCFGGLPLILRLFEMILGCGNLHKSLYLMIPMQVLRGW